MGGWVCCSPTLKTWGLFLGEYVRRNGWAGQGRGGGVDWKQCWMKSQTTVAGANQCRYPTEFDLEKSTFYLEKKSHFKKKCLDFSFSLFLSSPSSEVGSSFILVFFLFFFLQISTSPFFSIFLSPLVSLQEADCADFHSELLIRSPISMGAMSTMGRREVFCDLYSITVLPHCPVCFCAEGRKITTAVKLPMFSETADNETDLVTRE